ncbi:MAG: UPF0262 family protein [Alphaproteobacteria bacterium]|nr:UPF0262 family protein [Rhodospirillales bacterium]MCW9045084.1 UPF0262 family protein [Alphaproteobacteria bacterium]
MANQQKIIDVVMDEHTVVRRAPNIEKERAVAIYDLLEDNYFIPPGDFDGPYKLFLGVRENRLVFDIRDENDKELIEITISASSFRSIVKDYFTICDSYFEAIKKLTPTQIEAIDMGRRGMHNEGAELLRDRLDAKDLRIDMNTARRLFTLLCVLHIKG